MGGSNSKRALLKKHGHLLSESEREGLFSCFVAITGNQEAEGFTSDQFAAYLKKVNISASEGLVRAICRPMEEQQGGLIYLGVVNFINFVQNISWALKGSSEQKAQFFSAMLGTSIQEVEKVLLDVIKCILDSPKTQKLLPEIHDWTRNDNALHNLVAYLTQPLKQAPGSQSNTYMLTISELEPWLASNSILFQLLQIQMALCFIGHHLTSDVQAYIGSEAYPAQLFIPKKTVHPLVKEKFQSSLLDHATVILLNSALPFEQKGLFYPLFSSRQHGESFSTLCKQIMNRGPTLLVVQDDDGHVFGGFAADDWKFNPQFTGSSGCFLFTLSPVMGVYTPTGYNENFMYLQQSAQTLPNGLGMGGQLEYFGLWLSSEYGSGQSKARPKCTTYGSPCLAGKEEFRVAVLEAWGIGRPHLPDSDDEVDAPGPSSILDKDNTAKAMLELAGRPQHSEGLREPEEEDEN